MATRASSPSSRATRRQRLRAGARSGCAVPAAGPACGGSPAPVALLRTSAITSRPSVPLGRQAFWPEAFKLLAASNQPNQLYVRCLLSARKYRVPLATLSAAPGDRCIASIETALYALGRRLKQARLHDHITRVAGVDIYQAGLAVLYALLGQKAGLRG